MLRHGKPSTAVSSERTTLLFYFFGSCLWQRNDFKGLLTLVVICHIPEQSMACLYNLLLQSIPKLFFRLYQVLYSVYQRVVAPMMLGPKFSLVWIKFWRADRELC